MLRILTPSWDGSTDVDDAVAAAEAEVDELAFGTPMWVPWERAQAYAAEHGTTLERLATEGDVEVIVSPDRVVNLHTLILALGY